jgi:protein O-GlcNAc transferase
MVLDAPRERLEAARALVQAERDLRPTAPIFAMPVSFHDARRNAKWFRRRGLPRREALARAGLVCEIARVSELFVQRSPWDPNAWNDLGGAYYRLGEVKQAIRCFEEACARARVCAPSGSDIERTAHSNLLFLLNYLPIDRDYVFARHREWGSRHSVRGAPVPPNGYVHQKLRVGFLSGDFSDHPVAKFFLPIVRHFDRDRFDLYCFSTADNEDRFTRTIQGLCTRWEAVAALSDAAVAETIRRHEIDVLIDLAGHTGQNRLRILSARPAPVLVSYLGYPNTSGIEDVAYRISCEQADPSEEGQRYSTEEIVRIEPFFLCFEPPRDAPDVRPPPALSRGQLTFGCLSNVAKISDEVVETWSALLKAVPNSRLLVKEKPFSDDTFADRFALRFASQGVARDRLILRGRASTAVHLATFHEIDMCLDPFPYNNTTISFECLWMGVPFVTLAGDSHAARIGRAILLALGLEDMVGGDRKDYVARARNTVADLDRLSRLRLDLRRRLIESGLCDGTRFVRKFEATVWRMHAVQEGTVGRQRR